MVHSAAREPRRAQRPRLRGRHPAADDQRDPEPGGPRRIAVSRHSGAGYRDRSEDPKWHARRGADRRRVPRDGAADHAAEERRQRAQAGRGHRHRQLQEGRRRAWPGDGGTGGRGTGDRGRTGGRTATPAARQLPALPVPADLRRRAEMSAVPAFFAEYHERVHAEMQRLLPDRESEVARAMAYTVLAPSKQVRAVLVLLCAELCRGHAARAVPAAAAIELVHASSLILDDLPAMDNAPLRRGRTASHLEFGEATAILAAFGLLNLAYGIVAESYATPLGSQMAGLIANAVGPAGLIGGQALDLEATDQSIGFDTLERIHRGKTGALFVAAAACGALTAGAATEPIAALTAYA